MLNGYTLRIAIRDDLLRLYKAAVEAKHNRSAAMDATIEQFKDITHAPAELRRGIQAAAINTEKVAFANMGKFLFDHLEELEEELEEIDRQIELRDRGEEPYEYD